MIPPSPQDSEKESITGEVAKLEGKLGPKSLEEDVAPERLKGPDSVPLLIDKLISKLIKDPDYRNIAAGALFVLVSISVIASADSDNARMLMVAMCTILLVGWIAAEPAKKWGASILVAACFFVYLVISDDQYRRDILKDHWKEQHMQAEKSHHSPD